MCLFAFADLTIAQETSPSPTPVKKINQRPTANTSAEPFDNADVKKMSVQCVRLETESGNIEMEMFPEAQPEPIRNFLQSCRHKVLRYNTF
ncbi:MAG: peptidylprolyl isomerase [Blastocatellia bacterium]|nr:peptidylprolyl isomerase [Blastocatellia bacterium]